MGLDLIVPLQTLLALLRLDAGIMYTMKLFTNAAAKDWDGSFLNTLTPSWAF
jgi:hypothetical protein